jgi:hypothetical protein
MVVWMQAEMQKRKLSYRQLGKLGGSNYQNFQRVIQASVDEIAADTEDAICRAFGLTHDELMLIASGKSSASCPEYDIECEKARALWRWVAYNPNRIAALKAMGYEGVLPPPMHETPKGM